MDRINRSDIASESERVVVISRSLRLLPFRLADIPGERTANLQERGDLRVNIRIQGISVKLRSDDITTFRQDNRRKDNNPTYYYLRSRSRLYPYGCPCAG